jgi:hypothetical protein
LFIKPNALVANRRFPLRFLIGQGPIKRGRRTARSEGDKPTGGTFMICGGRGYVPEGLSNVAEIAAVVLADRQNRFGTHWIIRLVLGCGLSRCPVSVLASRVTQVDGESHGRDNGDSHAPKQKSNV